MMDDVENEPTLTSETESATNPAENHDEDPISQLIKQAREEGFNCLDLSKREIKEFPSLLLDFPSLQVRETNLRSINVQSIDRFQYLYLEGNQIEQLPAELFLRLPNLKWIDLRNNQLREIPSDGLAKHANLRYLLLGGNHLQRLPVQLGWPFLWHRSECVKGLSSRKSEESLRSQSRWKSIGTSTDGCGQTWNQSDSTVSS